VAAAPALLRSHPGAGGGAGGAGGGRPAPAPRLGNHSLRARATLPTQTPASTRSPAPGARLTDEVDPGVSVAPAARASARDFFGVRGDSELGRRDSRAGPDRARRHQPGLEEGAGGGGAGSGGGRVGGGYGGGDRWGGTGEAGLAGGSAGHARALAWARASGHYRGRGRRRGDGSSGLDGGDEPRGDGDVF